MPDLIGEDNIDWNDFRVTDPDAPEYEAPAGEAPADEVQGTPDEPVGDGVDDVVATEDTSQEAASPPEQDAGEEPVVEDPELPVEDPRVAEYLAKYGGDRDAAVKAAAHQDDLIGRQGQRIGELEERLAAQMNQVLEAVNRPPAPSLANLDTVFEENPWDAAELSLAAGARSGDWTAHHAVIQQWREIDPAQVALYENQKRLEMRMVETQRVEQPVQVDRQRYEAALVTAEQRLKQEYPDLDLQALQPAMIEEAQESRRISGDDDLYTRLMESGDPDKAYLGLRTLALNAHTRSSASTRQAIAERARASAAETQRAKLDAMVTTATATGADPAPKKSYDDELLEEFKEQDRRADGFNIGNY